MAASHTVYKVGNKRVPSVTTIVNRFKESTSLIQWAWEVGRSGGDYKQVRDRAGDIGTFTHKLIQYTCHDCMRTGELKPIRESLKRKLSSGVDRKGFVEAEAAYEKWYQWVDKRRIAPIALECKLVHSDLLYGGTIDCVAELDGAITLCDWKTGSNVYESFIFQLAGYEMLWEHNINSILINGEPAPRIESRILLHIPRTGGELKEYIPKDNRWELAKHVFSSMVKLYYGLRETANPWFSG